MGKPLPLVPPISIHALREEGDAALEQGRTEVHNFYPRPPRGGRLLFREVIRFQTEFLSTPSARRATCCPCTRQNPIYKFLSTPSARRATFWSGHGLIAVVISIHALREEGDQIPASTPLPKFLFLSTPSARRATSIKRFACQSGQFLSTPSARRATPHQRGCGRRPPISIHALREEGDHVLPSFAVKKCDFYPRPPRGGRPSSAFFTSVGSPFLSTPSARRATQLPTLSAEWIQISIHALREEGDNGLLYPFVTLSYFYPRPPRGGRQQKQRQNLYFQTNYTTFCTNLEEP